MAYLVEYTDTYAGEPNYCWVRRRRINVSAEASMREVLRVARAAVGLTGVKGDVTAWYGDEYHWVPRGMCTIMMVRWDDSPEVED